MAATLAYTYDNLNRITKVIYGDKATEQFTYDAAGNRLTHIITEPDPIPPTGEVTVNNGDPYTTSDTVTLNLSASDTGSGIFQMRFSNDGSTWSNWEAYATSKTWTLATGSGSKTVYAQFKDNAENISTSSTDIIVLDTDPPTGSIAINGGADYTTNPDVTLTLSASDVDSGVSQMNFSNDGISWTGWEPYATSKPWPLTSGNGVKTVYVQYQDGAGNPSDIFQSTILLTKIVMDFDGDNKSDISVWRPGDGYWYAISSKDESIITDQWGAGDAPYNDVPMPGDYDGDGVTDVAVWRPGEYAYWYILKSSDGEVIAEQWGSSTLNDVPVPGDYDGDGKTDIAVWRPAEGYWYIINSKDGSITATQWGAGYAPYNDEPISQ
jgi:YD repeat-containing protein